MWCFIYTGAGTGRSYILAKRLEAWQNCSNQAAPTKRSFHTRGIEQFRNGIFNIFHNFMFTKHAHIRLCRLSDEGQSAPCWVCCTGHTRMQRLTEATRWVIGWKLCKEQYYSNSHQKVSSHMRNRAECIRYFSSFCDSQAVPHGHEWQQQTLPAAIYYGRPPSTG